MRSMKLYDANFPGTRGSRVRWMLEELGVPYQVEALDAAAGEHKRDPYRSVHPHGLIPALEIDGQTLIDSAGICMHLAVLRAARGLAPPLGTPDRAAWYQWIVYAAATLDGPLVDWVMHALVLPEARRRPEPVAQGHAVWRVAAPFLERSLTGRTWLFGDTFSAADVVLGYDVVIASRLGALSEYPAIGAYAARLMTRAAFRTVYDA